MQINLNEVGKPKLQELAAKGTLKGLLVEYVGSYKRQAGYTEYEFITTSASDGAREHTVHLYKQGGVWWAECDRGLEDGCEAGRLGGRVCSHIAVSVAELKRMRSKPFVSWDYGSKDETVIVTGTANQLTGELHIDRVITGDDLEKMRQEVFEG